MLIISIQINIEGQNTVRFRARSPEIEQYFM